MELAHALVACADKPELCSVYVEKAFDPADFDEVEHEDEEQDQQHWQLPYPYPYPDLESILNDRF